MVAPSTDGRTEFEYLLFEETEGIAKITINRPEKMNALSAKTRLEIRVALKRVAQDKKVKSIILTGAGDKAFCAGQDISESHKFDGAHAKVWINEFDQLYTAMLASPKPIVTSNPGWATGAGWQLYLLGDYRIATNAAKFAMTEVNIGIPCITGSAILRSLIGLSQIPRLTIMCDTIEAEEALQLGIVNKLVKQADLKSATWEAATKLAEKPSLAVKLQKEWFRMMLEESLKKGVAQAKVAHAKAYESGEPQRIMGAFLEKKKH